MADESRKIGSVDEKIPEGKYIGLVATTQRRISREYRVAPLCRTVNIVVVWGVFPTTALRGAGTPTDFQKLDALEGFDEEPESIARTRKRRNTTSKREAALFETTKKFVRNFFWTHMRPVRPPGGAHVEELTMLRAHWAKES